MSSFPFFSQTSEESLDEDVVIELTEKGMKSFQEIAAQCQSQELKVI